MAKCAFLGLGVMGYPMAGHLLKNGHEVSVWNRTVQKAQKWASEYDGLMAETIDNTVKDAEFAILCVGDSPDVMAVVTAILKMMPPGGVIIDHTTASDTCARDCYALARDKNIAFIDAPISGGEAGAINGQLTIMCGGDELAYQRAEPILQAYGKATKLMGPSGAGQLTKMVNQICIAGLLQGLSEAINFAQKAGLNIDDVVQAIGKGAAQSWQMDNRAETMGRDEFDFGFAVDWMRKDLRIACEAAESVGADLAVTHIIDAYYAEIQAMGGNRWDTSSLIKRIR